MNPWDTATPKQIKQWIRDAALCQWSSGDLDAWHESRQEGGWTEAQSNEFASSFRHEIDQAEALVDKWLGAEAEIT